MKGKYRDRDAYGWELQHPFHPPPIFSPTITSVPHLNENEAYFPYRSNYPFPYLSVHPPPPQPTLSFLNHPHPSKKEGKNRRSLDCTQRTHQSPLDLFQLLRVTEFHVQGMYVHKHAHTQANTPPTRTSSHNATHAAALWPPSASGRLSLATSQTTLVSLATGH